MRRVASQYLRGIHGQRATERARKVTSARVRTARTFCKPRAGNDLRAGPQTSARQNAKNPEPQRLLSERTERRTDKTIRRSGGHGDFRRLLGTLFDDLSLDTPWPENSLTARHTATSASKQTLCGQAVLQWYTLSTT